VSSRIRHGKITKLSTIVITTTTTPFEATCDVAPEPNGLGATAKGLVEDASKRAMELAHNVSRKAGEMLEDVAHDVARMASDVEKKAGKHAAN
jgi:hypothetical protein